MKINRSVEFISTLYFHFRKLFQGRCFYYSSYAKIDGSQQRKYFENPYDITLCAQRMMQGHESDNRFYWFVLNRRSFTSVRKVIQQSTLTILF